MLGNLDIEIVGRRCFCLRVMVECIYNATHGRMEQRIMLDKAGESVSTNTQMEPENIPNGRRTHTKTEPKQMEHSPLFVSADG